MKKLLFILLPVLIGFSACTGVKTLTVGLEDEAYLIFLGEPNDFENKTVQVIIDGTLSFDAEVVKDHVNRPKGKKYAISKGTHELIIKSNNKKIYQKQILPQRYEIK
jgi:hypothetical protein